MQGQIKVEKTDQANDDMLFGALWCVGGTVTTFADFGYVFRGVIVFGAAQFVKGVINYPGKD